MESKIVKGFLGIVAMLFVVIGIFGIIGAFGLTVETSIHEIIQILAVLTSIILLCSGFIILTILVAAPAAEKSSDVVKTPVMTMEEAKEKLCKKVENKEE